MQIEALNRGSFRGCGTCVLNASPHWTHSELVRRKSPLDRAYANPLPSERDRQRHPASAPQLGFYLELPVLRCPESPRTAQQRHITVWVFAGKIKTRRAVYRSGLRYRSCRLVQMTGWAAWVAP